MNIIKKLREEKKMSQSVLAKKAGITRQTLIKYENGTTTPSINTLKKFAKILDTDYSSLIDNKKHKSFSYNIIDNEGITIAEKNYPYLSCSYDISKRNIEKFKQVLLYLLTKIGAKQNVGQSVIYKLLYLIDFDYYEKYKKYLMGLAYIKKQNGVEPVDFKKFVKEMQNKGEIEEIETKFFNGDKTKYLPIIEPNLEILNGTELEHINKEIKVFSNKTDEELLYILNEDGIYEYIETNKIISYSNAMYRKSSKKQFYEDGGITIE